MKDVKEDIEKELKERYLELTLARKIKDEIEYNVLFIEKKSNDNKHQWVIDANLYAEDPAGNRYVERYGRSDEIESTTRKCVTKSEVDKGVMALARFVADRILENKIVWHMKMPTAGVVENSDEGVELNGVIVYHKRPNHWPRKPEGF